MLRRIALALSWLACLSASAAAGSQGTLAPPAVEPEVEIHLITMGPGDHLYTRGGHAALMVAEMQDGRPISTRVYNYGDTDWEQTSFVSDFLRGRLIFFLSSPGDLTETVTLFGVKQSRDVYRQKLNLTPATARRVASRLEEGLLPENRDYVYHHVEAICTTKIRDLLNRETGGALAAQLNSNTDAHTVRYYVDSAFSGWWGASLGSDLLLGRMHDEPISEYYVLFQPRRMRELFQQVMLERPDGSRVPLAEAPSILAERQGPPAISGPNHFPTFLAWIFLLVVGVGAFAVYGWLPAQPRPAGVWLLLWSTTSGLIGVLISYLMLISDVPQVGANELIIAFPPTDLFLIVSAYRWLRGHTYAGPLLRVYAGVRVGALLLMGLGRVTGELYQQPIIWFWVAMTCVFSLWSMVRGMRVTLHQKADKRGPQKSTYLAYILGNIFVRLNGWRAEGSLPADQPRLVVIAAPHTSYWDAWYMLVIAGAMGYRLNFMGKRAAFFPPLGWLLRALGGVPIDRTVKHGMVHQMAELIRSSPAMALAVPPSGTRAKRDHWKSGFYHIALAADVPVACCYLDFKRKVGGVGPVIHLSGDVRRDMDQFREFYSGITPLYPELVSTIRLREEDEAMKRVPK